MPINKQHWYDGWFYDRVIAPNQDRLFRQVRNLIQPGSTVIDVGCGTGRLVLSLADTCKSAMGIDLSAVNVRRSRLTLGRNPKPGISFEHKSVAEILGEANRHFDYAVLTYVLHEVAEPDRRTLLEEVSCVADRIIIGDYLVPQPAGIWSLLNNAVERAAGEDHYANFKSFVAGGGIDSLIEPRRFEVLQAIRNVPHTVHLVLLQCQQG